jgi:hypothetical protein
MSPGQPLLTVKPMFKMPNNAVSHAQPKFFENRVQDAVKREDFTFVNMVPDLPADAAVFTQDANTLFNDLGLLMKVLV